MTDQPTSPDVSAAATGNQTGPESNWERTALERIALAAITEQRWRIFFRFAFLAVLAGFIWINLIGHNKPASGHHTALVTIDGGIAAGTNANAGAINMALDAAFKNSGTVGVVLRINSPGGSPVQVSIVYDEIRRLRTAYPSKPLYAVVTDICASGGYYIAAADKIYVDKASIAGSIGVLMDGFGFTGLMDKLGSQRRLHTSGENKGIFDPFSPETPKMNTYAQAMLDQIHAQFIKAVKDGRGARLHETPDLFSGLFWTGGKSVELGLADVFGTTDTVARDVLKAPDIVDYTEKEDLTDRLVRRFGTAVGQATMKATLANTAFNLR